jgi:hypothetical protein
LLVGITFAVLLMVMVTSMFAGIMSRASATVIDTNLAVAHKQYDLTKAGAWSYDIQAQTQQYIALDSDQLSVR